MIQSCMSIAASIVLLLFSYPLLAQETVRSKPKLEYQYAHGNAKIPIPTAEEPKVQSFNAQSLQKGIVYLEEGALSWTRERSCVACHTTGAYMLARPMLTPIFGKPNQEVLSGFLSSIQEKVPERKEENGISYSPGAERAVWRTAGLVQWDKHVVGELSAHTRKALDNLLLQQSSHGGYYIRGEVEIPYVTTDYELTLHAARAFVDAPGWLSGLKDPDAIARVERLRSFLKQAPRRNDYERVLQIELASIMPDLVEPETLAASIELLTSKQKKDGGWSTRSMSSNDNWRTPMSDTVLQLMARLPDASDPESDPYMTALAIILLRQSNVPADDPRIRQAIAWLKREQRESGRWWMHSLYRGNYHFTTYIATAKAFQALALCGELDRQ